jgi:hypothetical protein
MKTNPVALELQFAVRSISWAVCHARLTPKRLSKAASTGFLFSHLDLFLGSKVYRTVTQRATTIACDCCDAVCSKMKRASSYLISAGKQLPQSSLVIR